MGQPSCWKILSSFWSSEGKSLGTPIIILRHCSCCSPSSLRPIREDGCIPDLHICTNSFAGAPSVVGSRLDSYSGARTFTTMRGSPGLWLVLSNLQCSHGILEMVGHSGEDCSPRMRSLASNTLASPMDHVPCITLYPRYRADHGTNEIGCD